MDEAGNVRRHGLIAQAVYREGYQMVKLYTSKWLLSQQQPLGLFSRGTGLDDARVRKKSKHPIDQFLMTHPALR